MFTSRRLWVGLVGAAVLLALVTLSVLQSDPVHGSDHGDTIANVERIGADVTDVYIFPSPESDDRVVLVMNVRGLIPAGQGTDTYFDPGVLYELNVDTNDDAVEDLVLQANFGAQGPNQSVELAGPVQPSVTGRTSRFEDREAFSGTINQAIDGPDGTRVFAGGRSESFFFDIEQFCTILPDRCVPFTPQEPVDNPMQAQATSWRAEGEAQDFFADLNVLSIVWEVNKDRLGGGTIGVWATTSIED